MKKSLTHLAALAVLNPQLRSSPQMFGEISLPPGSPAPMYERLHEQSKEPRKYQVVSYNPASGTMVVDCRPPDKRDQISLETIRRATRNLRAQEKVHWRKVTQDDVRSLMTEGWGEIENFRFVTSNPARDV